MRIRPVLQKKKQRKVWQSIFQKEGLSYDEICNAGLFSLSETHNTYFKDNKFDPDKMLALLQGFYEGSMDNNCKGARAIGEMTNDIETVEDGARWLEYESRVSLLLRKYPVNIVCQFEASAFSGSTLMGILKVHPYMIIKGSVVNNPFFTEPEEYLASIESK